jgi:hypothetical protein
MHGYYPGEIVEGKKVRWFTTYLNCRKRHAIIYEEYEDAGPTWYVRLVKPGR